jgi:hypothetical protein
MKQKQKWYNSHSYDKSVLICRNLLEFVFTCVVVVLVNFIFTVSFTTCMCLCLYFFLLGIWVWFCNKWRKWDGGFVRVNYVSHQKKDILCFLTKKHNLNSLRKWDNFNSQFKQWILLICFQINFFKKKHKKKNNITRALRGQGSLKGSRQLLWIKDNQSCCCC